jgi:hypothetical protein
MPEWIKQGNDFCCFLYALCNSARLLGASSPEPGDVEWEKLVDVIGCRHGAAIDIHAAAKRLGLMLERVGEAGLQLPAILTVVNPCIGMSLHACLLLSVEEEGWRLIGYRTDTEAPVEELVDPSEITWPGPPNDWHWTVLR